MRACFYASRSRSTDKSPPTPSSPSSLASVGCGNEISFSLMRNTGMTVLLFCNSYFFLFRMNALFGLILRVFKMKAVLLRCQLTYSAFFEFAKQDFMVQSGRGNFVVVSEKALCYFSKRDSCVALYAKVHEKAHTPRCAEQRFCRHDAPLPAKERVQ